MIGFPLGLLYANAAEWMIHKHVLHGAGKSRKSFWSFHFHEHHQACRKHDNFDPDYDRSVFGRHAQGKELLGICALVGLHLPLLPIAPFFTSAVVFSGVNYYRRHKRSHQDIAWGKEHMPWHYDHHMGPDQDQNWCVSYPWFDLVMGTRVPYLGTERARLDAQRRQEREARRAAASAVTPEAPAEAA